jgi:hypothetical protein
VIPSKGRQVNRLRPVRWMHLVRGGRAKDLHLRFPGLNTKRDSELHQFLLVPIDSYRHFEVPEEIKSTYRQMIRASEPSSEVKSFWEGRIRELRSQSRMMMRRPMVYGPPQIAARQVTRTEQLVNHSYNCTAVEAIAGRQNRTFAGPMYHPVIVPQIRSAPCDLLRCPRQRS